MLSCMCDRRKRTWLNSWSKQTSRARFCWRPVRLFRQSWKFASKSRKNGKRCNWSGVLVAHALLTVNAFMLNGLTSRDYVDCQGITNAHSSAGRQQRATGSNESGRGSWVETGQQIFDPREVGPGYQRQGDGSVGADLWQISSQWIGDARAKMQKKAGWEWIHLGFLKEGSNPVKGSNTMKGHACTRGASPMLYCYPCCVWALESIACC